MTTKIQDRFTTRNTKRARRRTEALKSELNEARVYHQDPLKLLRFISTKILWLTVLWIGQGIVDVIFGFVSNASYLASIDIGYLTSLNFNQISSWTSAAASLTDMVILTLIFRSGLRAYRLVRRVINFDGYESYVERELRKLNSVKNGPVSILSGTPDHEE